jgi:uncharacterized membrane protein
LESTNTLMRMAENPAIDRVGEPLSKAVRRAYEAAGPVGQQAKNALHGVWLGHPLHPVLTDVPLGAWTTALALDAASNGDPGMRRAATFAMGVGLTGALGAAVTGLTDWSETDGRSRRAGLIHGLLNLTATALFATAFVLRKKDAHEGGRTCAWAGYTIALSAAYLGGDLVYGQRIGVTHADAEFPEEFTPTALAPAMPTCCWYVSAAASVRSRMRVPISEARCRRARSKTALSCVHGTARSLRSRMAAC